MKYHRIPNSTMQYHSMSCTTMQYNPITWKTRSYYTIPSIRMHLVQLRSFVIVCVGPSIRLAINHDMHGDCINNKIHISETIRRLTVLPRRIKKGFRHYSEISYDPYFCNAMQCQCIYVRMDMVNDVCLFFTPTADGRVM